MAHYCSAPSPRRHAVRPPTQLPRLFLPPLNCLSTPPQLPHNQTHAQITTVDEAKQFYPLFGLGANVALIFSGRAVKIFSQIRANLPPGVDGWGLSLRGLMSMVVVCGLIITGVFWYLNRTVSGGPAACCCCC